MIDFLKSWIINIVALVMLIILLEMMVPSGKLKKIISLIAGFILIIAIITPILNFFKKGVELKDFQISETTFLNQKELEASANKLTLKQSEIILETYKNKLISNIEKTVSEMDSISDVKAEVIVEENKESKDYGNIKRMIINVKQKEDSKSIKPVTAIKKITIGEKTEDGKIDKMKEIPKALGEEVKNKVSKLYNITQEQIAVGGL